MDLSRKPRVLIIVENLPSPFDRRVWQEAQALVAAAFPVTIICPKGWGYEKSYEYLEGVHIYRHPLPVEADSAVGYVLEYGLSLIMEFWLTVRVACTRGFDVIQACNPPDTIFIIGAFFKLFGKRFIFDHHDVNPELYEAKFSRRDIWYRLMRLLERCTFATANVSIATNDSFRRIAMERGRMPADRVFVVRSGPDLSRIPHVVPKEEYRRGRRYLVGYVGVIGKQEGIDLLLESIGFIRREFQRNDIQFVIIGDGTEVPALQAMSRQLQIDDCVEFTGRLTGDALWQVLGTSDVCVSPDRVNQMNDISTMNKVLEYMALGKPIVQFDLTEGRYSAGDASLYATANDIKDFGRKICELLDAPERRAEMGSIGRQRLENTLAWQHQVPQLLQAYAKAFE